ncbi:hypothetical protein BVC80_9031g32 [Macleaya cordata]|uniref:Uncharacterized protein n=1 Tax=Macleaya cordata TaxID=56857 RepID=A0A200R8M8_MACCD|nr:hypothetical protein BVC80_9031g32 [Macleaya cordata]
MGSNDDAVAINKPFSIRDYVLVARQKDISQNWPFPDKYLQTCMKHGITKLLPPFESCNFARNPSYREEENSSSAKEDKAIISSINKSCVEFDRKEEIIKVYNIDVSTSSTKPSFNNQMDQCLTAVPSSKRLKSKRKKRKRKRKKRSMVDICAKARPCTLEELDKINGSNWAIDQRVVYRGTITSDQVVDEVNGSVTEEDDRGTKLAETSWKTKHPRDDNAENDNVVVQKRQILKFKLNGRKPKSQNIKVNPRITNESKIHETPVANSQGKRSSINKMEYQPAFQDLGGKNSERPAFLWNNNTIEAGKDSGHSEKVKLKASESKDTKCLQGPGNNSFTQHPSVISAKNILNESRRK